MKKKASQANEPTDPIETLRSYVSAKPTRKAFLAICQYIEEATAQNREQTTSVLVPYLQDHLAEWPAKVRMAPTLWLNKVLLDALPLEVFHLVSAVNLTCATVNRPDTSQYYKKLVKWLKKYPADGPAPEGITWSRRPWVAEQLHNAIEAEEDKRFCTYARNYEDYGPYTSSRDVDIELVGLYCDEKDFDTIFSSPFFREVRVLDLSIDVIYPSADDEEAALEEAQWGRYLTIRDVLASLSSDRLEVLDLHGQLVDNLRTMISGTRITKREKSLLAGLKILDMKGYADVTENVLKGLAKHAENLEKLYLSPADKAKSADKLPLIKSYKSEGIIKWSDYFLPD